MTAPLKEFAQAVEQGTERLVRVELHQPNSLVPSAELTSAVERRGDAFRLLRAKNIGLADETAILLYVLFHIVYVIAVIPAGILSDRIGRRSVLIAGYLIFAIVSFGLIFTSSLYSVLPFFAIYGISFAMFDSVQRAYVVDFSPA